MKINKGKERKKYWRDERSENKNNCENQAIKTDSNNNEYNLKKRKWKYEVNRNCKGDNYVKALKWKKER